MLAARVASRVVAYEASPYTFRVLSANAKTRGIEAVNKAVVGDDRTKVEMFLSKGLGATNSIVKLRGKRCSITVPAVRYEEAVKGASVVKVDVEGAEYEYDIV